MDGSQSKCTRLISPAVGGTVLPVQQELCSDIHMAVNRHTHTPRNTERSYKKIALFSQYGPPEDNVTMLLVSNVAICKL